MLLMETVQFVFVNMFERALWVKAGREDALSRPLSIEKQLQKL